MIRLLAGGDARLVTVAQKASMCSFRFSSLIIMVSNQDMDYLEVMEFEQDECITLIHLKFRTSCAIILTSIVILAALGFYFFYPMWPALIVAGIGGVFLFLSLFQKPSKDYLKLTAHNLQHESFGLSKTIAWNDILQVKSPNFLLIHHLALTKDKLGEEVRSVDILRVCYDEWGRECVSDGRIVYLELALEWIEKLRGAESDDERRSLIQEWKKPVEEETAQPKIKRKLRIKKRKRPRFLNPEIRKGRLRTLFKKRKRIPTKEEHETVASTVPLEDHAPRKKEKNPKWSVLILLPIFLMLWMVCTATVGIALRSYFEMGWVILICFFISLVFSSIVFYFWTKDPDWMDDFDEFS